MNIAVVCLAYGRPDFTAKSLAANLPTAGAEFSLFFINQKGIAKALNEGLKVTRDYDAVCFLANDIIEPNGWMYNRIQSLADVKERFHISPGMVSYPIDRSYDDYEFTDVIGNILITKEVIDKVGYFNESLDPYGPIDCDYNHRVKLAGFVNYYLPFFKAHELQKSGSDETDKIYGYSKRESIRDIWSIHESQVSEYISGKRSIYLPFEQC